MKIILKHDKYHSLELNQVVHLLHQTLKLRQMKEKALKKVQIAIDKMVDLEDDYIQNSELVIRVLESLRELEDRIYSSKKIKNGLLRI